MNQDKYISLEQKVFADFASRRPNSQKLHQRAQQCLVGGGLRPFPLFFARGQGCYLYDIDGNQYIDGMCQGGPVLLGHGHPEIEAAVKQEMEKGFIFTNPDLVVECAEMFTEVVPCAQQVKFRNTGLEVCQGATMIARAYTGKNKIIKFYGDFHGNSPEFLVGWGVHSNEPISAGVPREMLANTITVMPVVDEVRRKLDEDKDVAAVITDVIQGVGGIFPFSRDELQALRDLCTEREVLLIYDEVLTGFRMALGGSQEYYGVVPDIGVFAKAVAGGAKFGVIAGSTEVMSAISGQTRAGVSPYGPGARMVPHVGGTMDNGRIGMAAAIASMKVLKRMNQQGEYNRLNQRVIRYARAVEEAFRRRGIGCYVHTAGSYYKVHITPKPDDPDPDYDAVCQLDQRLRYLFTVALMNQGFLYCIPGSGSAFISFSHTDDIVDQMLDRINTTLDRYNWAEVYSS